MIPLEAKHGHEKSTAEVRANMQKHYGELTDMVTDPKASEDFHRPAYQANNMIRIQGSSWNISQ